jgi:quercetin dioxygenase-like cupin family protein
MFHQPMSAKIGGLLLAMTLVSWPMRICVGDPRDAPPDASVVNLLTRELISGPDKEVVMLTVTYPAAGASLPHRHDAQVFVYVLEGELTMQVRGSAAVTLRPGQTFYEAPQDVHVVSANTSNTAPAKILVIMIKDKGKPGSRAVAE